MARSRPLYAIQIFSKIFGPLQCDRDVFNISVKTISKQSPNCSKIDVIEALIIALSPFQLASDTYSYCNVLYYVVSRQICTHVQVHVD